jgi:homogentisate 1,2-dioxygenase
VAEPCEIVVIQRGIKFSIDIDSPARGYILEIYGGHFTIPDLGPIGANGLANSRDFLTPKACFEDSEQQDYSLVNKFSGEWFVSSGNYTPFNVVAWHGNFAPYKYDLRKFCCMNSVTYDHPDPSIYTVLTCASPEPGTALADFVIFPPRWMVMEGSFRPPYFHRNCMSEYMGMVYGEYDAKAGGFVPGGSSLHTAMTAHGPDAATFEKASDDSKPQVPEKFEGGLAFMFETCCTLKVSTNALQSPLRDTNYADCWKGLPKTFVPPSDPEVPVRTFAQMGL